MKIETMINKLNRYFVDKLLNESYKIMEIDHYHVTVMIDSKYDFCLWHTGDADSFKCYYLHGYFMRLSFTENEKIILHMRFQELWNNEQKNPKEIEKRRKEYEKLKAEFEPEENKNIARCDSDYDQ